MESFAFSSPRESAQESAQEHQRYPESFQNLDPETRRIVEGVWDEARRMGAPEAFFRKMEAEALPENEPEPVVVETPVAKVSVIYERHGMPMNPNVLNGKDFLVGEGTFSSPKDFWRIPSSSEKYPFTGEVVGTGEKTDPIALHAYLKAHGMPQYSIDIAGLEGKILLDQAKTYAFDAAVGYGGGKAAFRIVDAYLRKEQVGRDLANNNHHVSPTATDGTMSRRAFLKRTAGYAAVAAAVTTPLYAELVATRKGDPVNRGVAKLYTKLKEEVGVADVLFILRNAVMAQKALALSHAYTKESHKKPDVAIIIGAGHKGIEEMLAMDEKDRLRIIEEITEGLLKDGVDPKSFDLSHVVKTWYDKDSGVWRNKIYKEGRIDDVVKFAQRATGAHA